MIEVWEALDCESLGARELEEIQSTIRERFGEGAVDSPASIARTLAEEGAVLRHPEVLEFDTNWRERFLSDLIAADDLNFSGLEEAAESIKRLEAVRTKLEGDQGRLSRLRDLVLRIKEEIELVAGSRIVDEKERLLASEIVEWLTVWLKQPDLFDDWLSLRQRSAEYTTTFEPRKHTK